MKYEVLKRIHIKRNIIVAVIIILILSAIILTFTKAKYKTTASIPLVNGTINYDLSDLNLIGVYIQEGEEYKQTNEIPSSGYKFNSEESYCTINNERDDTITLSFDMTTQNLTVTPLTKKGTKCYLYFDEQASGNEYILASPNAPTSHTIDWTGKESYYYTGKPDNWVSFAGFYWRIIRINGDGSIRIIYQGVADSDKPDGSNETGTGTQIGESAFNSSYNNNMYVGFKYTSNQVHGTRTNSTILGANNSNDTTTLNGWYRTNLLEYAEYLDGNAGFCGDRTPSTIESSSNGSGGTGTTETYYGAYIRLYGKGTSNSNPSLQCDSQDVYTTTDSSSGNKSLQYPIGLITADELALTGITYNNANTGSYLYTGEYYWTMSPAGFYSFYAQVFVMYSDGLGILYDYRVTSTIGVRPVINLRADVQLTGTGSQNDPFVVVTS